MKIYNKKSEILRDLGKDSKDTKYLDRAIERGEVLNIGGYYIYKNDLLRTTFEILHNENILLKKELENSSGNSERVQELEANVEYYKNEAEEKGDRLVAAESILEDLRNKGYPIGYAND